MLRHEPHPLLTNGNPVELGVVIGKRGRDISQEDAMSHVTGYGQAKRPALHADITRLKPVSLSNHSPRRRYDGQKPSRSGKGIRSSLECCKRL